MAGGLAVFVDPADGRIDLLVQRNDRFGERVVLCEMQAEPEPVVIGHPPMERVSGNSGKNVRQAKLARSSRWKSGAGKG